MSRACSLTGTKLCQHILIGNLIFADVMSSIVSLPPVCNSLFKKKQVEDKVDTAGEGKFVVLLFVFVYKCRTAE